MRFFVSDEERRVIERLVAEEKNYPSIPENQAFLLQGKTRSCPLLIIGSIQPTGSPKKRIIVCGVEGGYTPNDAVLRPKRGETLYYVFFSKGSGKIWIELLQPRKEKKGGLQFSGRRAK